MMRKITFRAWILPIKAWATDIDAEFMTYGIPPRFVAFSQDADHYCDDGGYKTFEGDDVIIVQYTGLKDKNGKEIYESDRCRYKNGNEYSVADVVYSEASFYLTTDKGKHLLGYYKFDIEVIGNTHEQ